MAVKLGPYFSSMANMAQKLDATGVDGLVLFNRFYQPDYDLESLEAVPNLILSNSHELLLRLHWIAVLCGTVKADMALTGGVHCATDVVKAMMAGAKVAMMTSAILNLETAVEPDLDGETLLAVRFATTPRFTIQVATSFYPIACWHVSLGVAGEANCRFSAEARHQLPGYLTTELLVWMGEHEYDSIRQMQGSMSRNAVPQPKAFERANYVRVLSSYAMR